MKPGLTLRTSRSSATAADFRHSASKPMLVSVAAKYSAAAIAAADRLMDALDLRHVERARGIADQHRARHLEFRHGLPAAGRDAARARGEDFAALQERMHLGVMLELLERFERAEARIDVVEPGDEADVSAVVVEVIDEAAAIGARVERPAQAVLHQAGLHAARRQLPQLFHAERIDLRVAGGVELVALDELLGEAAAAAFGDDGEPGVHFRAGRVVRAAAAVVLHAHVADLHAGHRAVVAEQRQRGGEAREHVDAELLGLRGEPLIEAAQRDDEVARVVQRLREARAGAGRLWRPAAGIHRA